MVILNVIPKNSYYPQMVAPMMDKDIESFVKLHIIKCEGGMLIPCEIYEIYKKYLVFSGKKRGIAPTQSQVTSNIKKILKIKEENYKMIASLKKRVIIGYKCNITLEQIKTCEDENLEVMIKDKWEKAIVEKLKGTHICDKNMNLKTIQDIVDGLVKFCLLYKSPCGSGKTNMIIQYIEHILGLNDKSKILFVCGKRALGRKQIADLKTLGFVYYEDVARTTNFKGHDKFIVSIDSLHKVAHNYDFVILDEISSTFDQLVTYGDKHIKKNNIDGLCEVIREASKIIIADAFLRQETADAINMIRQDIIIYENTFPRQQDKNLIVVTDEGKFLNLIKEKIISGKKIIIPCGSKEDLESLHKQLNVLIPNLNIKSYHGDTKIGINVTEEWHEYDIILHTSVIDAGASFVREHFSCCMGYYSTHSFSPDTAVQTAFRSRILKDGEIYIFIKEGATSTYSREIKTVQDMKNHLIKCDTEERVTLQNITSKTLIFNKNININHYYFSIYADVKLKHHLGLVDYMGQVFRLFKSQGVKLTNVINRFDDEDDEESSKQSLIEHRELKKENRDLETYLISIANDICDEEAKIIKKKDDAVLSEKRELTKYKMMKRYKLKTITPEFIKKNRDKNQQHTNVTLFSRLNRSNIIKSVMTRFNKEVKEQEKIARTYNEIMKYDYDDDFDKFYKDRGVEIDKEIKEKYREELYKIVTDLISNEKDSHINTLINNNYNTVRFNRCACLINILQLFGIDEFFENAEIPIIIYDDVIQSDQFKYQLKLLKITKIEELLKLYKDYFGIKIKEPIVKKGETTTVKYKTLNTWIYNKEESIYTPEDMFESVHLDKIEGHIDNLCSTFDGIIPTFEGITHKITIFSLFETPSRDIPETVVCSPVDIFSLMMQRNSQLVCAT